MLARFSAFVIWALVAATVVFWGLRLFVRPAPAPAYALSIGDAGALHSDLSRVLGSTPVNVPQAVVPVASSRFKLFGIVSPRNGQTEAVALGRAPQGVALIAVDGKMPKAFAVGAHVDGDLVLQSVSLRTVSIAGQGAAPITLELPPPSAPATGTLPGAMVGGLPAPAGPTPPAAIQPQFGPQSAGPFIPPQVSPPATAGAGVGAQAQPVFPGQVQPQPGVQTGANQ